MKIEVYSPTIRRKEMDAVLTAMVADKIGPGDQAKFLIQIAKEKIKFDFCLALRSPAVALALALKSLNLEPGQGVIVSALSPLYYSRVIEDLGLKALYCDVQASTCCISRETVEKALASKPAELDPRCIVIHNTLGYISDTASIAELGIPLIEDCSQSYGTIIGEAENEGDKNLGDAVFTILGLEEKDMLTSGGGALLFSFNRRDGSVLRSLGDLPPEYGLPDMNAALAVVQFREASKNLIKRREIARLYTQAALRTRHKRFIQGTLGAVSQEEENQGEYNNYAFPLILEKGAKEVKAYARRKEIAVESAFENTLIGSGLVPSEQCPESYSLSLRTVLFPLYPRLRTRDAENIAKLLQTLP